MNFDLKNLFDDEQKIISTNTAQRSFTHVGCTCLPLVIPKQPLVSNMKNLKPIW